MTPEERETAAKESCLYWIENLLPAGIERADYNEIWEFLLRVGGDEEHEMFDPAENYLLALLQTLMVFDGYLPSWPRVGWLIPHRERTHRMASVDVAAILEVTPTQLAGSLRQAGVPPRQMRLDRGRNTKAYERFDIERAWRENFGDWMEALAKKPGPRGVTIREAIAGVLTPAASSV